MISIYSFLPRCTELHKLHNDLIFLKWQSSGYELGESDFYFTGDVYLDFSERGLVNSYEDLYNIQGKKDTHHVDYIYYDYYSYMYSWMIRLFLID